MDERLIKRWEVTAQLLQSAASEIASPIRQRKFARYLKHNELELALDVLEAGAAETTSQRKILVAHEKDRAGHGSFRAAQSIPSKNAIL